MPDASYQATAGKTKHSAFSTQHLVLRDRHNGSCFFSKVEIVLFVELIAEC